MKPTRAKKHISNTLIRKVEREEKTYIQWDDEILGFGLKVPPTGSISFVLRYVNADGKERLPSLGILGAITADEARTKAKKLRDQIGADRDPLAEKEERRAAPTIAEIIDSYLASKRFSDKADSTQETNHSIINGHILPLLGKRKLHELTTRDIERAFADITAGKTARSVMVRKGARSVIRGGEGTARKSIKLLRAILNWHGGSNPAAGVDTGSDGTRDLFLEDDAAYARFVTTLNTMEATGEIRTTVAHLFRLVLLTGMRVGEARKLVWRQVEAGASRIVLPPKAHKSGRKTKKAKVIILPASAQAILATLSIGEPDAWVFPPTSGRGPITVYKEQKKLAERGGFPKGFGSHAFGRHSIASHMAMSGATGPEIQTVLNHADPATSAKYIHWAEARRAPLAEKAAGPATAALHAAAGKASAEVVPIGKRR